MSNRIYKINKLLKSEVGEALKKETPTDAGVLTVTAVETTADMRQATVWLGYFGEDEGTILDMIKTKEKEIQKIINHRLSLKHVPKLTFKLDHSGQYADNISELIRSIKDDDHRKDN